MVWINEYKPHPKQKLFHADKHQIKVFLCGIGTGKTLAAVIEAFYQAMYNHPKKIGIMAAPTYPLLVQGLLQTWIDTIPRQYYQYNSQSNKMVLSNGSTIYWRSTSNASRLQAINAAWCVFDEAATENNIAAYNELTSRLRAPALGKKTQMIITTTPNGANWLPQTFGFGPHTTGFRSVDGTQDYWEDVNGFSCVIRARTWDNPIYPIGSDYLNQKLNGPASSPEYIDQYIKAEFTSKTGLVFDRFLPHKHIINTIPSNVKRFIAGHDFGFSGFGALVVFAETTDNKLIAVHEEYHKGLTSDEYGWFPIFEKIKSKYNPEFVVCDSASPERIVAIRRKFPRPYWIESKKDTLQSIHRAQKLFNDNRLLIHSSCKNLIREMQNWSWKKDKNGNAMDITEQGSDHSIDALRYCLNELSDWFMSYSKNSTDNKIIL